MGRSHSTSIYIHNIREDTKRLFSGENPNISHLRIFGIPVYIHVPKEQRINTDPSGKKGTLVGYR